MELVIDFNGMSIDGCEVVTDYNILSLVHDQVFSKVTVMGSSNKLLEAMRVLKIGGDLYVDDKNSDIISNHYTSSFKFKDKDILTRYEAI